MKTITIKLPPIVVEIPLQVITRSAAVKAKAIRVEVPIESTQTLPGRNVAARSYVSIDGEGRYTPTEAAVKLGVVRESVYQALRADGRVAGHTVATLDEKPQKATRDGNRADLSRLVTVDGAAMPLAEASEKLGVSPATVATGCAPSGSGRAGGKDVKWHVPGTLTTKPEVTDAAKREQAYTRRVWVAGKGDYSLKEVVRMVHLPFPIVRNRLDNGGGEIKDGFDIRWA